MENGQFTFRQFPVTNEENNRKTYVTNFYEVEQLQKKNRNPMPETCYDPSKSPHLYSWFVTDKAMVMLLSDNTFQVNAKHFRNDCLLTECHIYINFTDQLFGKSSKNIGLPAIRKHHLHQQ